MQGGMMMSWLHVGMKQLMLPCKGRQQQWPGQREQQQEAAPRAVEASEVEGQQQQQVLAPGAEPAVAEAMLVLVHQVQARPCLVVLPQHPLRLVMVVWLLCWSLPLSGPSYVRCYVRCRG